MNAVFIRIESQGKRIVWGILFCVCMCVGLGATPSYAQGLLLAVSLGIILEMLWDNMVYWGLNLHARQVPSVLYCLSGHWQTTEMKFINQIVNKVFVQLPMI